MRSLSAKNELSFISAAPKSTVILKLANSQPGNEYAVRPRNLNEKDWDEVTISFALKKRLPANQTHTVNELHLMLEIPYELLIDDLLIYGPGE
ncbi:MAG: hypothetical protein QGG55_09435 [Verrucomicrobiota bacterium]|nr:hypothetical protein [Verrucomicrobiota bacterium]|tara:strand:+ start:447 stop:725 length:279 start_codon:yes stop_codon:yes gene_type:complete